MAGLICNRRGGAIISWCTVRFSLSRGIQSYSWNDLSFTNRNIRSSGANLFIAPIEGRERSVLLAIIPASHAFLRHPFSDLFRELGI